VYVANLILVTTQCKTKFQSSKTPDSASLSGTTMSKLVATPFTQKLKQCAFLASLFSGTLMVTSGCGIPCQRGALPGAPAPHFYSWNNGNTLTDDDFANHRSPESEQDHEIDLADQGKSKSHKFLDAIKLTNFVHQADLIETNENGSEENLNSDTENKQLADSVEAAESVNEDSPDLMFDPPEIDLESSYIGNSSNLSLGSFFNDPYLTGLINQALSGNQELRILAEEINIANNEVHARSGEYRPFVTLGAGAGVEKSSRFSRDGAVEDQLLAAPNRGFPEPLPDFMVATNISWELDIWRKLRNAQDAACMRYLGSAEGRNYIVTRLSAEVAESYYELLALDNRLLTLDKTIEIQQQSLDIARAKKVAGRGTELAVQRFQAEVRKNQSEKLIIQQEVVEVENRINFLAGRYPQHVERISVEYIDFNLNTLSAGLPSELLRNRADIRQAEREVAAAGLDVKVARARFYPSFALNAGIGLNAYNMRYLLATPESLIYNAALDLVGPLINKRAIQADYRSANAAQLQAIYDYQRTVLNAHIEVVNHMTKVENYRQSIEIKKEQLQALEESVDAANKLFQNARAEYVEVLLAQRELMEAKMLLIETKQQQLSAIVNAYQALGGGGAWTDVQQ